MRPYKIKVSDRCDCSNICLAMHDGSNKGDCKETVGNDRFFVVETKTGDRVYSGNISECKAWADAKKENLL